MTGALLDHFIHVKNGICNSCLAKHENKDQLVLPLSKLKEKDFEIDLGNFLKSLAKFKRPVLFYHHNHSIKEQATIKFTGHENFEKSFQIIKPFLPKTIIPATIISPYALSKNNRLKEQKLVLLTKKYFEPLGFIKLQLHSVTDYHKYAESEKVGLLMMPLKDLPDYMHYRNAFGGFGKCNPSYFSALGRRFYIIDIPHQSAVFGPLYC